MRPEMGIIIDVYYKYAINAINICIYIYVCMYITAIYYNYNYFIILPCEALRP